MSQHNTGYVIPYHGTCVSQHVVCHYHDIPKQARSHWLGWSGFNLTTYTQFMQLRFNKLIISVAIRTSFVKNATVF